MAKDKYKINKIIIINIYIIIYIINIIIIDNKINIYGISHFFI